MVIWILIILILIGIFLAISLYNYDNSEFSKMTGYSYIQKWTDKKVRDSYKFMNALQKANGEHYTLLNVKVPVDGNDRLIDAILIHESGIYVIDVKQYDGWIYGREQDVEWAQALHKNQLIKFDNPVLSNKRVIFALREMLPEIHRELFYSLIAFTDRCSFTKIDIQSGNVDVIKVNELKQYWLNDKEENLSKEQMKKVYQTLEMYMDFSTKLKSTLIEETVIRN